jgi:myosin heavy subunit
MGGLQRAEWILILSHTHTHILFQAEYVREGIDWRHIDFVDNQAALELIEGKLGLLSILDEQCRLPRVSGPPPQGNSG